MTTLSATHVVTPQCVLDDARVRLDGDRIVAIEAPGPADEQLDGWLLPGYIDSHTHGGDGADYATTDPEVARHALAFGHRHGATTIIGSLVSADVDVMADQLRALAPLVAAGELAGVHLEGPFLAEARKGAHDVTILRDPTHERVSTLLDAAPGTVAMVTLAPEREFGIEVVRQSPEAGVRAAFGHSAADADQTRAALDAGATVVTHTFNAMRSINHREPGPVPVLLNDDRALIELICDGVHVHPDVLRMAIDACGVDRVALVTDAMAAAGRPDGLYDLGPLQARVIDGVARIQNADGSLGSIAGSTLTMDRAVEMVVSLGFSVAEASRMASANPARWHGLDDVGVIAANKRADFCVTDDAGALQRVMLAGRWI